MKAFLCALLFSFISFLGSASKEFDFINKTANLKSDQLERLEADLLRKSPAPFSEEQIHLKIVQFQIYCREDNIVKRIEILLWFTNNKTITNKEYLTWAHYNLATALSFYEIPDIAIEHSSQSLKYARETGHNEILYLTYSNLGNIYFKEKQYEEAKKYFLLASQVSIKKPISSGASDLNNIGLCYQKMKQYKRAEEVFKKSLALFNKPLNKDEEGIYYLVLGNLGSNHLLSGKADEGIQLIREELEYQKSRNLEYINTAGNLIDFIRYYILKGQKEKIPGLISRILNIIDHSKDDVNKKIQIMEILIDVLKENNITVNELQLNKSYNAILLQSNREFKAIQTSISKLLYEEKISNLIARSNYEKKNYVLQQKNNRLFYSISATIAAILILLLFNRIRTNKQRLIRSQQALVIQQQKEELVKNEQVILQQQFQNQKLELNSLLTNLSIKQQTETGFLEKIKELKRKKNISPEQIIQELQLSVNNLIEIDRKFINESVSHFELNPEFSSRILEKHPELTELEIRYCNYFITGLSSKEIGLLHNLSDVSVRVLKNKIKNKLGLRKDDSMIDYLKQFVF